MDEQTLALLHAGDARGIERVQAEYGGMVRYIVRGILPDAQDAEECISDIYLRVWARIASYDAQKGSFAVWLTAIARNAAVDRRRKSRTPDLPLEESAASAPSPEDEVLRRERAAALQRARAARPDAERLLFYRKYYYLQSTAQIAAELGLTERAVEGRLYRLRRRLQKTLGGEDV